MIIRFSTLRFVRQDGLRLVTLVSELTVMLYHLQGRDAQWIRRSAFREQRWSRRRHRRFL